jgi:hypothetical protein
MYSGIKNLAGVEHETEVIIESASHDEHQANCMREFVQHKTQHNTELAVQSLLDEKCNP